MSLTAQVAQRHAYVVWKFYVPVSGTCRMQILERACVIPSSLNNVQCKGLQ